MRIDKWLWAARFFKTRALASRACELGRIQIGNQAVKASREIRVGDRVHIKNDGGDFQIDVLELAEMRGPAAKAQTLYAETDESKAARAKAIEDRKLAPQFDWEHDSRPSKKDRRLLSRFRGKR